MSREFSDAPSRVRAGKRSKRLASGRNGLGAKDRKVDGLQDKGDVVMVTGKGDEVMVTG